MKCFVPPLHPPEGLHGHRNHSPLRPRVHILPVVLPAAVRRQIRRVRDGFNEDANEQHEPRQVPDAALLSLQLRGRLHPFQEQQPAAEDLSRLRRRDGRDDELGEAGASQGHVHHDRKNPVPGLVREADRDDDTDDRAGPVKEQDDHGHGAPEAAVVSFDVRRVLDLASIVHDRRLFRIVRQVLFAIVHQVLAADHDVGGVGARNQKVDACVIHNLHSGMHADHVEERVVDGGVAEHEDAGDDESGE